MTLIATGAFIKIPLPFISVTLQTFMTTLAGMVLGPKRGATACLLYMAVGLIGLPIFTMGGGPAYVFQPTFGYILGFAAGAALTGIICEKFSSEGFFKYFIAALSGIAVVYLIGIVYYCALKNIYYGDAMAGADIMKYLILAPLPGDILTCVGCAAIGARLKNSISPLFGSKKQ